MSDSEHGATIVTGITLRDWFAAQALQGFLSQSQEYLEACRNADESFYPYMAEGAYMMADAMLKARGKR